MEVGSAAEAEVWAAGPSEGVDDRALRFPYADVSSPNRAQRLELVCSFIEGADSSGFSSQH